MKSEKPENSEEKIKKVTEFLTKLFRFCFYLIIAPFAISLAGFAILYQIFWGAYKDIYSFTISVIIFTFAFLFFYKSFDKYRNNPFFYNKSNNPIARVHIIFLISILSYVVTPIFVLITPEHYSFIFLPLISFALLYNIVYYYYYFQPIDFFNIGEGEFKHAISLKLMLKQPYNFVIVINYLIQILYLSFITSSDFAWLFGLINNLIFYLITLASVSNQQKEIKKSIKENKPFLKNLTKFKRKFVLSLASFMFVLLIQMPIISLVFLIQRGQFSISVLIDDAFLSFLFVLLFLKTILYIYLHYEFLYDLYTNPETSKNPKEENKDTKVKYQKLSSLLTGILILLITLYTFLIELPYIPLIILPFFFIFSHYEHKSNYSFRKYDNFIILLYSLAFLASISFGILPSISDLINFNIQLIVFFISFYFILELFRRVDYFKKGNILITQNILAVIAFFLIIINYVYISTDPYLTLISNVFIILILYFVVLLLSFYRLYAIFFKEKYSKTFKICVLMNLFLIELFIFILINFNIYLTVSFNLFIKLLVISTILFPLIFMLFVSLNYLIGMINLKTLLASIYYSFWSLIVIIFLSILITFFPNYIMMIFNFLLLLILINFSLKFGVKIAKVKEETYKKAMSVLSYPIFLLLLALIFSIFYTVFQFLLLIDNVILSSFLTLIITCVFINYLSTQELLFTRAICIKVNLITLLYSSGLIFYYLLLLSLKLGTFYVFIFPPIITCSFLYIPIVYLLKLKLVTRRLLVFNGIILSLFITLIPTIIYLELINLGLPVNNITIISDINFTLCTLFGILTIINFKIRENLKGFILRFKVSITFILTGTTVFFYFFIIFYETSFRFLLPLIIASIYFFIPTTYSYRKRLIRESIGIKMLTYNSLMLSGLILCVPTFIYLELINLGLPVDVITVITDINFTLYTLFGILIIINFKIRENLKRFILRFKVSITFILTGTTVFFYFFIIFSETSFRFFLPLMLASIYFYIPSTYSYRKKLLKESIGKKILTYNTFLLTGLILCIPTFIYLELISLGLTVDIITVITDINFTLYTLFGILIIMYFKIRENLKRFILKLEVLIATLLTGTTVFFYFFIIFSETSFRFLLPLMLASIYFFIPSTYSYRKGLLKESIGKKSLIYNSILLSGIILCVPTLMGLQIERMGLSVDYILILIFTIFILFVILKIYESIAENFKLKEIYIKTLRFLQIFVWLIFSCFISFEIILLGLTQSLLTIRLLIISCSILTFFIINIYTLKLLKLISINYFELELTFLRYLKDTLYYGLIFSPSLVIFSLIQLSEVLKYLPTEMQPFNVFWYLGFFFLIAFISFKYSNTLIKLEFPKLQRNIEFISWLIAKVTICFFISFILTYFLSLVQFSVFNLTITFILIVSLLSPITFSYFEKFELISKEYRFFIKRFTVILFITDILSFILYSWLFNNPIYGQFNLILTATLTLSLTGLAYVLLFYKSRLLLRRISFFIVLPCIVISFPIFLYFFISVSLSIPFGDPFPLIIAIDVGIFLFYLSIGLYHWKFSWAIWRTGWYAWFIVPFANFYLLYRSLKGVDIATSAIDFFGYEINGSFLLTTVIFFLFFLPIAYTKIKIYFYQILLIIWGINLALLYWISQNLFLTNFLLRFLVFALFAAVLLAPLFYKLKFWKTISFVWLILIAINANFLIFFLLSLEIPLDIAISIDIFAIAMLVLILSFFPAFKSIKNLVIISSYITAIIGIFLTIYFILFHIILDPIFALNITFIFVGFSLFSSKYIKPIKRLTDMISSWILIFGISWLTFNSFNLFPNLLFFAIFLAIAVWGGSFYVFNYYKMKIHIHKIIPFSAVSFGISSAVSSFLTIFLPENPFFIAAIFVMISLLFVYYPLGNYRLYLWYLFPLPLTFLFQELFLMIDFIQSSLFLAILILLIDYLIIYQIVMNISNSHYEEAKIKGTLSYFFKDKNQIKLQNLICFIINSIYFSILISVISVNIYRQLLFRDLILIYQILNILIILPFLLLFCIKYIIKSELELKVKNVLIYIHKISYFIYIIVPLATAFNLFLLLLKLDVALTNSLYLFLIILSGMLFTELFIFDNHYFYYLFVTTRNKLMFWSWVIFGNFSCIFLYFFHLDEYILILSFSLVNLIDSYFISYFNIKNENLVSIIHLILIYNSFIWVSFYISSQISNGIVLILEEVRGIPSLLLFIQNSILFLFIFSFFIRKAKEKIKITIKLLLIALFHIIFAINWIVLFSVFNILNLFTIYFTILIETCISFITVKLMDGLVKKEKFPNFLTKSNSLIVFLLYLETSLMVYGLAIEFLGFFESISLSQLTLFILTSFDIYFLKKIRESYGRLIHTISYFILSLSTLLILNQFVKFNPLLISIEVFIFLIMQFYTNHSLFLSLFHFYPNKEETFKRLKLKTLHSLGIFLYVSVLLIIIQSLLIIGVEISLLILITSLFLHGLMILDASQLKLLGKLSIYLKGISWLLFKIFFAINWIVLFSVFHILNLFTIYFLILIETCLTFITIKYLDGLFKEGKFPNFLTKSNSLIIFLLYLETSLMIYGLAIEFLGFFESISLSQLTLFILTSFDIYFLKKIRESYGRLIHTISYFILSLSTLLILNQFVRFNPLLISIEVFIFLIMQFYTNHSFFLSLFHFNPDKAETYKRLKLKTHHSLGILLYVSVLSILIQSLLIIGVEISLLILITSLFLHGLMILDAYQLKLLGKLSMHLKAISWLLFMFFSNYYLIWIYVSYLSDILISSIPPLILLLIIELFYLIKLFEFLPKLSSYRDKIRKRLLTVLYFDFIIWPLFFLGFNLILNISLFLISFYVLVIISYIDERISHIFEEKFLKKLRFVTTLIILIILIVNIFSWLHFSFNLSLPLNICISLLIFSIFNIGLIKPYKRSHNFSFAYGGLISLLISLIIYFATSQTVTSILLFSIILTFYLFIFMLEVLKTLFNKLLDLLIHFFNRLKKFIKYIGIKIFDFLKLHYKIIWVTFSLFLAVSSGILLSPLQLNYLPWYHSIFVMLGLFGLLSLFLPSKKTEDVDLIFKHRMRKLITSWITVIAILFLFIKPNWYIFALWISIWIMGAILLPYVIHKERKDNISVKWRFYTLIIILTAIIIVGIPAIFSILIEFNVI